MRCRNRVAPLAAIALVLSVVASAAGPRFGVTGGPQLTELVARSSDVIGWPEVSWTLTGFGGATAELPLPGGLVFVTGLEYGGHSDDQVYGATTSQGGGVITGESRRKLRQRMLSMPARVMWRPGRWRLGAGPELRYLLSAEQRWQVALPAPPQPNLASARGRVAGPAGQIFESVQPDQWYDATSLFRRWSLAAQLAVGREMPLGEHAVRADLRWSEGITRQQWSPEAAQRTRAAQLAFGLLW